jgi:maleylpyruvate isomerase
MTHVPEQWIQGCTDAHRRLEAAAALVADDVARRPSALEGWTVGHVLNHLARNADSHTGVFAAAARGEIRAQYPGGPNERVQLIEDGAYQPADVLIANLRAANSRLENAWSTTTESIWAHGLGLRPYGAASLAEFIFLRWREVELHAIDLGIGDLGGPEWSAIPDGYLDLETAISLRGLLARLPERSAVHIIPDEEPSYVIGLGFEPTRVSGPRRTILRWLTGRGGDSAWPKLAAW